MPLKGHALSLISRRVAINRDPSDDRLPKPQLIHINPKRPDEARSCQIYHYQRPGTRPAAPRPAASGSSLAGCALVQAAAEETPQPGPTTNRKGRMAMAARPYCAERLGRTGRGALPPPHTSMRRHPPAEASPTFPSQTCCPPNALPKGRQQLQSNHPCRSRLSPTARGLLRGLLLLAAEDGIAEPGDDEEARPARQAREDDVVVLRERGPHAPLEGRGV
eukprot:CAMPEP_0179856422 /NCGR_PEP_ID=MMETSP0982-20121206/11139_1 /TAXON_ID=483367 /ORGANISM="non described non described, Strain CCMP 2436" /LENGTH=219 /DNA_ID=CAMNT_0021742735 /DNA_START=39 /DNA_END=699 /DNA_ORIENTATION=+